MPGTRRAVILSGMSSAEVRASFYYLWLYLRLFTRIFFIFMGHAPLEAYRKLQVLEVIEAYRDEGAAPHSCVCLVGS